MPALENLHVFFPLLEKNIFIEKEATVAQACSQVGFPQNLVCGAKGTCKKCLISVRQEGKTVEVLGCQHPVCEGMEILISKETSAAQILETTATEALPLNPQTKVFSIDYSNLTTEICSYDLETIQKTLKRPVTISSLKILKKCSEVFHLKDQLFLNFVLFGNELIDLVPSNEPLAVYGVAFDIGTTSVVGFLYHLETGVLMNQFSLLNKQISFGADVISRIDHASKSPENLKKMQTAILETINEILAQLCDESQISKQNIYDCVFCGNSSMAHLFFGLNPIHLGLSPFIGVSKDTVLLSASELPIAMNPLGKISFFPLLGGFVGGDTSAVLLSLPRDEKYRLMIDLGTNGEIAIGNHHRFFVASTACGPALEGAGIHMGMRGTIGAIETVRLVDSKIQCQVIGNVPALGFCGSGIIDAIALLYQEGLVQPRGNFIKEKELESHPFKNRFGVTKEGQRYFIIISKEEHPNHKEIIITQKDIRQVQLAKAAIFTGCCLLAKNFEIQGKDLSEIVIAGAFGNYIDIENAQSIGLLPKIEGVPIRSIGNAAGIGAQVFLLSQEEIAACKKIPSVTSHIELASDANFTNTYMMNTALGQNLMP